MRRSQLVSVFLFTAFLFVQPFCYGQSVYKYHAELGKASAAGFYKIVLEPSVVAKCLPGFEDIRVIDGKGNQVPYILKTDYRNYNATSFVELPVLSVEKDTINQMHVVIQNKLSRTLRELLLVIRNTDANRTVTISGSDDNRQWFVIKENIQLGNFYTEGKDRFIQSLQFPPSSYNFFKVIINGKDLLPVNIARAGVYEDSSFKGKYQAVPAPTVVQIDSLDKSSYVRLQFKDQYMVDKMELEIVGPRYFKRDLSLDNGTYSFLHFTLGPSMATLEPVSVKSRKIDLVITNEDNPPLKIVSVKAYQLNRYLLAWLEPAETYQLVFGDSSAAAPRYDLEFFKDSIRNNFTEITVGPIQKNTRPQEATQDESKFRTVMLWVIIAGVLALMLFLTLRMAKEVGG